MSDSEEKTCKDDSEQPTLVMDVVRSILERLSVADFHRARCISSEWYYASKSLCIRVVTNPWIILRDYDSCMLFDPHENISYTVRNVGFDFAWRSRCLASCGNWFLMVDDRADFHISNVFTRESIPLPPLESIDESPVEFMRINDLNCLVTLNYENKASRESSYIASHLKKCSYIATKLRIGKGALYVDEKSRYYVAVWNYDGIFAYHRHKKGDDDNNSWKVIQSLNNQGCVDMVFKDGKLLYVLCNTGDITVFDFSGGDSPMECASFKTPPSRHYRDYYLVVTLSGEVLIILPRYGYIDLFDVYKMDHKSLEWSIINSIGDEAVLLDQGITIAAKDGVMKDCIYYTEELDRFKYNDGGAKDTRVYNIKTKKVVISLPLPDSKYPRPFNFARWFFPTFG